MLSKDLAAKLERFKIRKFQVSRRIIRMNKRLAEKLNERLAEQRGWHLALTNFAVEAWGETEN